MAVRLRRCIEGVRPPGQAGAASAGAGIGGVKAAETTGSDDSPEIPEPERVSTSAGRNSVAGHNYIA